MTLKTFHVFGANIALFVFIIYAEVNQAVFGRSTQLITNNNINILQDQNRSLEGDGLNGKFQNNFLSNAVSQEQPKTFVLEAAISSAGVTVKTDNKEIYHMVNKTIPWGSTTARVHAGVHLIVLHQKSGLVLRRGNFLTWQPEVHKQLLQALMDIKRGRLLILLGSPEFTQFLSEEVLEYIESLGSNYVKGLTLHDQWCFIGWKGEKVLYEVLTTAKVQNRLNARDVSPIRMHCVVPILKDGHECPWYSDENMRIRAKFCETYDGYGDFCSCDNPWSPNFQINSVYAETDIIPLAIVTSRRLPHVLRQVGQIRRSPGGSDTPITIFVDGYNAEARDLGQVLGIPVVEHDYPILIGK
ncbi:hypothetical protein SK128_016410 [Halocaridina rubra]|uniref:ILEI/PANDER domain-containing protein n=1 Tax=Halocaridina rubra TaxID=373956 RepID=A0AAN9A5Q2_HALRR